MEKKVVLKLKMYQSLALCRFTDIISATMPQNTDFHSKLIIANVKLCRKRIRTAMLNHKHEYRFTLPEHEALALSQAMLLMPKATNLVDNNVLETIQATIHQKLV